MTRRGRRVGFRVSDDYIANHPNADPSATELVINVFYTAELLHARMDRILQRLQLSPGGFNLLQIAHGAGQPISPTELGEQLIVTTATVTGVLDTLQRRGLITRAPDPVDRRRILVDITPTGAALLERIADDLIEREKAWADGLTRADREGLTRTLGTLQRHLLALPPEP
jgi:DNA-binding MarR family transcriptional regulator